MKEKSKSGLQWLIILAFAALVSVVGMRMVNARETGPPKATDMSPGTPKLLTEAAAVPGKVVRAVEQGKTVASYTCTPQDAAIAWISNRNNSGQEVQLNDPTLSEMPSIVDSQGNSYPFTYETHGTVCLVKVYRGYAKKPDSLTLRVPRADAEGNPIYRNNIKLSDLADPIVAVQMPSAQEASDAEKILIANFDPDKPDSFRVRVRPNVNDEARADARFYRLKLLATTFQPVGEDRYPAANITGRDVKAARVQVEEYKRVPSEVDLVYKDASVAVVNGVRTLRLPATEDVGEVRGVKAFVRQRITVPKTGGSGPVTGDLLVVLERRSASDQPGLVPTVSIKEVSPSVDEMGLDLLRARLVNYSFGRDFLSSHRKDVQMVTEIPVLTMKLEVLTPSLISTKVYTVPVGRRHISLDYPPGDRNVQRVIASNSLFPSVSLAVPPKNWLLAGAGIRRAQVGFHSR